MSRVGRCASSGQVSSPTRDRTAHSRDDTALITLRLFAGALIASYLLDVGDGCPLAQRLPPVPVLPVPLDGLGQPLLEADLRRVAELTDLAVIHGITQVVPATARVGDLLH